MTIGIQLSWGARTDRGLLRRANEDALIAEFPLFLVADGMGGHEAGDIASGRALDAFRHLVGREAVALDDLVDAFHRAVRLVSQIQAEKASAGTTISGVAVSDLDGASHWLVMNIGDSRTYRLLGGELEQISVDHSAVQELIDAGRLAPADAERHPERHVITKAVGAGSTAEPDYWLIAANAGDRLLICSDGLSKEVDAARIASVLREEPSPEVAATRLVDEALRAGGHDNISVIVVDADTVSGDEYPTVRLGELDADTVPRAENEEGASHGQI